jgi:hypothetical protein
VLENSARDFRFSGGANEIDPKPNVVVLLPVAIRIPNSHSVYSPSKLRSTKEISYEEFLLRYANHFVEIYICFDEEPSIDTILERSELVEAYGFGRDGWYIIPPNIKVTIDNLKTEAHFRLTSKQ